MRALLAGAASVLAVFAVTLAMGAAIVALGLAP